MSACCCSLAGTAACRSCSNNPYADFPPTVRTNTVAVTDRTFYTQSLPSARSDVTDINVGDTISRQAVLDTVRKCSVKEVTPAYMLIDKAEVMTELMMLPSAQPMRKKGKWIDKSGGIEGAWNYCSVCGEQAIDLYDFCPNCGADLRGDNNGNE